MKNVLAQILGKDRDIVIGAIHLPPLLGHADFPGFDVAIKNALDDLRAFEKGGVDGVIFENNYDIPHREFVTPETAEAMMRIGKKIRSVATVPLGISVLWNDYKTAMFIAKTIKLKFVRVPVFVDKVKTSYGIIEGKAEDVLNFRKSIKAESVAIFADIHVKHSEILSKHSITESAKLAIEKGADALIVTGKWTGNAPDISRLETVKRAVGDFPILVGSGANKSNIGNMLLFANGVIVSTSVKLGSQDPRLVNRKDYECRIDIKKVRDLASQTGLDLLRPVC